MTLLGLVWLLYLKNIYFEAGMLLVMQMDTPCFVGNIVAERQLDVIQTANNSLWKDLDTTSCIPDRAFLFLFFIRQHKWMFLQPLAISRKAWISFWFPLNISFKDSKLNQTSSFNHLGFFFFLITILRLKNSNVYSCTLYFNLDWVNIAALVRNARDKWHSKKQIYYN